MDADRPVGIVSNRDVRLAVGMEPPIAIARVAEAITLLGIYP
jgi:hypothetical protein